MPQLLKDIIAELISLNKNEFQTTVENTISSLIQAGISDTWIIQANTLKEPATLQLLPLSSEVLTAIDDYTKGEYDKCCQQCIISLKKNPEVIELYEIYCKSLIEGKKPFFIQPNISATVDKILEELPVLPQPAQRLANPTEAYGDIEPYR